MFTEQILKPIQEFIQQTQPALDELGQSMAETLKLTNSSDCKGQKKKLEELNKEESSTARTQEIDNDQKQQNKQLHQTDDQQQTEYCYKCPICNEEAGNNIIACDECSEWETITNPDIDIHQKSVSSQPLSTNEKVQQQPMVIEEKKESNESCQKTTSNVIARVHTNEQEMGNDRRTPSHEYTENYIIMNTSPKEKESSMMSKQSLNQIEDQTYMKQPLIDTTENSKNVDKQKQKQTAKRFSTKNQQN
ncbi:unnamed protein product [Mytilus coruscus]|uniref:Uncharacterized protein n=1 Tax=Mytilus coruscus TaxID=42192 RepID=A0A6J8EZ56_MYTCO|nr:unnamed protein product [Mytilus coruscus]